MPGCPSYSCVCLQSQTQCVHYCSQLRRVVCADRQHSSHARSGPFKRCKAVQQSQPACRLQHLHMWHSSYATAKHRTFSVAETGGRPVVIATTDASNPEQVTLLPPPESHVAELCDSGMPDPDLCDLLPDPPKQSTVFDEALSRGRWLLGLLILQSTSSFVLDSYQQLLKDHIVVTLFLTMLVGAGGNAGNQSAIKVIRGLATGSIKPSWQSCKNTLQEQAAVGLLLGTGLSVGGFIRVYITNGNSANAAAISISLFTIVMTSVLLGSGLPFVLTRLGVDPANAGTSIQVLMDILGVVITCVTCQLVLVQFASSLT